MANQDDPFNHSYLERKYVNYFQIGHNGIEFVIDCGQYYETYERPLLTTQVITSPHYAKVLLELLQDSINQYEEHFGRISTES